MLVPLFLNNSSVAAGASPPAAPMVAAPEFKLHLLFSETWAWLRADSTEVLNGTLYGLGITVVLLAIRFAATAYYNSGQLNHPWLRISARGLKSMRWWFMVAGTFHQGVSFANAPFQISYLAHVLFVTASAFQIAIALREIVVSTLEYRAIQEENIHNALGIVRFLLNLTVFSLALVFIFSNLGVDVTGLIAGLGVGGIAIGLAAQGIFSDLFAALSILFDRPFRRGENIRWDETEGVVESIGLKSTRVRATTGEEVVISNAQLLGKEMHNLARRNHRQYEIDLGVTYQTPVATMRAMPEIVRMLVDAEPGCSIIRCGINQFGESSVDFEARFHIDGQDNNQAFMTKHRIMLAIFEKFEELGIDFAYPTQASFTLAPDGEPVMPGSVDLTSVIKRNRVDLSDFSPPPAETPGEAVSASPDEQATTNRHHAFKLHIPHSHKKS